MGRLITASGSKSVLISNAGNPILNGIFLVQNDLINGRKWYKRGNNLGIAWSALDSLWVIYIIGSPAILHYSISAAQNPWDTSWDDVGIVTQAINLSDKKISIKKQNIIRIKPYSIDSIVQNPITRYVFKGGTSNTINTVFNYLELLAGTSIGSADNIVITKASDNTQDTYYYRIGLGTGWKNASNIDSSNVIINSGDIIYFISRSGYKELTIPQEVIIQKYDSGKLNLNKVAVTQLQQGIIYRFLGGSNNTLATFFNTNELNKDNNVGLADKLSLEIDGTFVFYYIRSDSSWRRIGISEDQSQTIIQNNQRFAFLSIDSLKTVTVQGTNIIKPV